MFPRADRVPGTVSLHRPPHLIPPTTQGGGHHCRPPFADAEDEAWGVVPEDVTSRQRDLKPGSLNVKFKVG